MFESGCQIEATHGAGGRGELVGLQAEALQHRDEEIWQRIIVLGVEGEMLAMLETAASEESGEIRGYVGVGISKIGTVENHGAVEERLAIFAHVLQIGEKIGQELHVPFIDGL